MRKFRPFDLSWGLEAGIWVLELKIEQSGYGLKAVIQALKLGLGVCSDVWQLGA